MTDGKVETGRGFRARVRIILFVLGLVGAAGGGWSSTTGQLEGWVQDHQGGGVAGAAVTITSDALIGGPRTTTADSMGRFFVSSLPVGDYEVETDTAGFLPARAVVRVRLERTATVTFRMIPVAFFGETVVTTEIPVVDTSQVSTNVEFGEEWLQTTAIGADQRSFIAAMRQAPGVTGASVFGSTAGDNTYLIDGINTSDPAQGIAGTLVNFDAIEEMSLQTGGFEARFGLAIGGVVNLVTKSGGNSFSGSADIRYRSGSLSETGENSAASVAEDSLVLASATAGGAILRDRLWFFAAADWSESSQQYAGDRFPIQTETKGLLGKLTWQALPNLGATLFVAGSPSRTVGVNAGDTVTLSASETLDIDKTTWWAEANWLPSEAAIVSLQVGSQQSRFEPYPSHGDGDRILHVNDETDLASNSSGILWSDDRKRDEVSLTGNLFFDGFGGAHELEAGVVVSDLSADYALQLTGGAIAHDVNEPPGQEYVDLNGDGYFNDYLVLLEGDGEPDAFLRNNGTIVSSYLQDAWRPLPRLSIKPGLRFDTVRHTNNSGEEIAATSLWQPRFGIAWDLFGDARHVVRASVGRFMDPSALSLAGFTSFDRAIAEYTTLEFYCNRTHGARCEPDSLPWPTRSFVSGEGVEYHLIDNRVSKTYQWSTVEQLGVADLRAPHADQLVIAWESRIAEGASLELSWVTKRTEDLLEDTCEDNAWVWSGGPPPELEDPSTWTTFAGCGVKVLANIPGLERSYEAFIARLEARSDHFHLLASYTLSSSEGTTEAGPVWYADDNADFFPSGFVNWDGRLSDHRRHRVKLNGFVLLPRQWTVAFAGFWSSAGQVSLGATCEELFSALRNPNGETRLAELGVDEEIAQACFTGDGIALQSQGILLRPRGDFETSDVWQVDLQVSKTIRIARVHLTGVITVLNVFGHQPGREFNDRAFRQEVDADDNPVFDVDGDPVYTPVGAPLNYWLPRRFELGVRLEF